jgi:hypothetical protein
MSPIIEIGKTEILLWDVYYGNLEEKDREKNIESK